MTKRQIVDRRRVLMRALVAAYELIDRWRQELAELDAKEKQP